MAFSFRTFGGCALWESCLRVSGTISVSRGLAMLALDTFFNQLDHAVVHGKLHQRLAVDAANQHLAQQRVNNAMKLDELRVVCLAESEFSRWSGGWFAQLHTSHRRRKILHRIISGQKKRARQETQWFPNGHFLIPATGISRALRMPVEYLCATSRSARLYQPDTLFDVWVGPQPRGLHFDHYSSCDYH